MDHPARYAALRPAASNWRALVAHPAQSLVALMALMTSLTIRIDDDLKQRLRAQAVRNGRSMEEEVRNRSINPVLADGFFQEAEAEAGEQFHGSSAS